MQDCLIDCLLGQAHLQPTPRFSLKFLSYKSVTSIFMLSFTVSLQIDTASFLSFGCISLPLFVSIMQFFLSALYIFMPDFTDKALQSQIKMHI